MENFQISSTRRQFLTTMGVAGATLPLLGWLPRAMAAPGRRGRPQKTSTGLAQAAHVLRRTSYGSTPVEVDSVMAMGWANYLEAQLNWQAIDDSSADWIVGYYFPITQMTDCSLVSQSPAKAEEQLSGAKLIRAVFSQRQLYEVMVGFWTDHFNIDQSKNDYLKRLKIKDENEVIRPHALGSFRSLLNASARSVAMQVFLDNWRNIAWGPNENYARELLELHTLGVDGGYSESDVKEVARCLTGWSISVGQDGWPCATNGSGFVFYPELHDPGVKQVLGTSIIGGGISDGEAVLDLLVSHPATARHISRKLCRFFVGPAVTETLIGQTAAAFGPDGDISAMLRTILLSGEFLSAAETLYRRPFDYGTACLRGMGIRYDEVGLFQVGGFLDGAGHLPYVWPDPDGYPLEQEYWLSASSHLMRWQLAISLAASQGQDGQPMSMRMAEGAYSATQIVQVLSDRLVPGALDAAERQPLVTFAAAGLDPNTPLSGIHRILAVVYVAALLMSTAAFQLY